MKGFATHIRDALDSNFPASPDHSGNQGFVYLAGSPFTFLAPSHQRFVYIDYPEQCRPLKRIVAHRFADFVTQKPSCLV